MDLANIVADEEALKIVSPKHDYEPVLCSGSVGLRLRYAGRNFEECPYNRLRSYSLDAVDRSDSHILESVYLGIGGVVTTGATVDVNSCRAIAGDRP
ncbi:hypothetical protein PENSOL_c082G07158 [Penicillium solitum]|uniref:Uncharacterized protein n=1 Tax=Penicillium solitum TaxID=60172 RepID=A0A1V6QCH4_9EURO|nr:uncharacterized protein PENSOL_c082G07158 [Penicillium solitum]OQD86913.1 hypothetical protein PENSOL_c082G07158 [Penicillium solitum]